MKALLLVLALASTQAYAAPLVGTCKGLYADCVGPKLDTGARITKRCELNDYRTSYYAYEYTDTGRRETGTALVTVGSSSAVSDSLSRTTYPETKLADAVEQELTENGGMSRAEAKAALKKLHCKKLANEVLK